MPDGGIRAGRLPAEEVAENFRDLHPPLSPHEAAVAADRCYFCYDAPCVAACPTEIDIPLFIRQIRTGRPVEAAVTILEQNILGGMCARVCPTETLCEEACVRMAAEEAPVEIGLLQRVATDTVMAGGLHPFARAEPTGRRIAVVGAGPAGLACAHRLAMRGHDVVIHERRDKPGGLNEYGIAAYKTVDGFAQAEVDWLLGIGGIEVRTGEALGDGLSLGALRDTYDAVFLSVGLGGVNALRAEGSDTPGAGDAVEFIAGLRQSDAFGDVAVGSDVVVIGGGMTAVDAAVQSKLLGAERVTIVYRRGRDRMAASSYELDLAAKKGVAILTNLQPVALRGEPVETVEFERTGEGPDGLAGTGEIVTLPADMVLRAIGQALEDTAEGVALRDGRIEVDGAGRTSLPGVWAGGDCVADGDDLTVTAVAQGRDAAEDIHAALAGLAPVETGAVIGEAARGA